MPFKLSQFIVLCRSRAKTRQKNVNQQRTELMLSEIGQKLSQKHRKKHLYYLQDIPGVQYPYENDCDVHVLCILGFTTHVAATSKSRFMML